MTAALAAVSAAEGPLAGVWTDGELTLTLQGEADAYEGTFALEGRAYDLTATGDPGGLTGSFRSDGADFAFVGSLSGEVLRVETGGAVYALRRPAVAPVNPLARKAQPPAPAENLTQVGGYRFRLPAGWRAEADAGGSVALYPPGVVDAGTDEVYVLTDMTGVERADDPALDQVVRESMLGPQASAAVYEADTLELEAGTVALHSWRLLHIKRRLDAYVKESLGRFVAVVSTGLEEKIAPRREAIREIAATLAAIDPPKATEPAPPVVPALPAAPAPDVRIDPAAPPFKPGVTSDGSPESEDWRARLAGKRLTRVARMPNGESLQRVMQLAPDGTLEYRAGPDLQRGWWRILTSNGQSYLAVVGAGAPAEEYFPLVAQGSDIYFGSERVILTDPGSPAVVQ